MIKYFKNIMGVASGRTEEVGNIHILTWNFLLILLITVIAYIGNKIM